MQKTFDDDTYYNEVRHPITVTDRVIELTPQKSLRNLMKLSWDSDTKSAFDPPSRSFSHFHQQ